jgi:hypothetical protein
MKRRDDQGNSLNRMMPGMLLVIRHAHAGDKRDWDGPDGLRPLSPTGRAQADGLVVRLADFLIQRIVSSPTVRCQQTVRALARERRLSVEWSAALRVQSLPTEVLGLVHDLTLRDAALCTHGEVIDRQFGNWLGTAWSPTILRGGPRGRPGYCNDWPAGWCGPATSRRFR